MGGRLKIGGYVEPKPLEEMDIKVVPASPPADSPPSYDSAVAQARAEQKLIGTVLLKTSHYFGMHPFKDPYTCDGVVCKKRRIVLYVIQFFFAFGAVIEILQNLMIELHPAVVTNTTHITMMPLKALDHVTEQASVFIDRYYFPIINFGVVKIPQ
uniref:Uncharacterized protein n=1 Tax=Panagrolaimus sp. JU765 TaxID=591449 RepID=A0AC34QTB0_9BILA